MSGVVELMHDGEDEHVAAAAVAELPEASSGAGGPAVAAKASSTAAVKHAGEMELETPFVEKYRPMFVSFSFALGLVKKKCAAHACCSSRTLWATKRP